MKISTRTNRPVFRPALAGLLAVAIASAHALAAPPVQVMAHELDIDLPLPGVVDSFEVSFNDRGQEFRAVYLADPMSTPGIAIRNESDWQWVFEPMIYAAGQEEEVWTLYHWDDPSDGRIVVEQRFENALVPFTTLREFTPDGGSWATREIVTVEDAIDLWDANGVGQTAYQVDRYVSTILLEQGGTTQEVLFGFPPLTAHKLRRLFDDGTYVLRIDGSDFGCLWNQHTGDSIDLDDYSGVYSAYFSANDTGEWVTEIRYYGEGDPEKLTWDPVGDAVTPSFSIHTSQTAFKSCRSSLVSRSGEVAFRGELDDGTSGVFLGPDAARDLLISAQHSFFADPIDSLYPMYFFDRRRVLMLVAPVPVNWKTIFYVVATRCPADVNRDAIFDHGDISEFVILYLDGSMRTDFNNDGYLDNADIIEFITQFLDGC